MSNLRNLSRRGWIFGGLATFAATVLPVSSASAAASTSVRSTPLGALLATLSDPAAASGDQFGNPVAVSGNIAVIGAHGTSGYAGAAYVYVKGTSGWPTTPTATLSDPAATADDDFGSSVAVSGETIVVGAYGTNEWAGAAYIYVEGASGWPKTPTATLHDPAATSYDYYGSSVAVSGETAFIGTGRSAGAVYIYVRGDSRWPKKPTATLSDPAPTAGAYFGSSLAVSGKTAAVGAYGTNSAAGAAYIYVEGASGWPTTPAVTLSDPAATADDDEFGDVVAVSGKTAVIGADGANSSAGAAYIYVRGSSGWPTAPTAKLKDPAATSYDEFGSAVAVSGETTFIGAPRTSADAGSDLEAGAAYIYVKGSSGWPTKPTAKLKDPAATSFDFFGSSVALSGKTAVVGAYDTNSEAGAAYMYKA